VVILLNQQMPDQAWQTQNQDSNGYQTQLLKKRVGQNHDRILYQITIDEKDLFRSG
jgi:hypothetical protein